MQKKITLSYVSDEKTLRFTRVIVDDDDDSECISELNEIAWAFYDLVRSINEPRTSQLLAQLVTYLAEWDVIGTDLSMENEQDRTESVFIEAASAHVAAWKKYDERLFNS